jgi:general nucleoside transport system permease protein
MFRLLRYVKRSDLNRSRGLLIRGGAIIIALLVTAVFIMALSLNPIDVYSGLLKGAFGSTLNFQQTVITAIPLVICALGVAVAFKMQFWNIGGEGQIMMGAFAASIVALKLPHLPMFVMLLLMAIAGIIGGALWAMIPAFFKAKWKTNETIVTLMMNYIALKWITYLQYGPWKDPSALGFPKIPDFTDNAILPNVFGIHMGWIIALILVVVIYIFMNHTKLGYEVAVLGESERTAQYSGISVRKTIILGILLSGGMCGLAGMIQASAVSNTLSVNVSGGVGFTAIIVAWLSGLSAPIILVASVLFAGLINGGSYIQSAFGIPAAAAQILQGLILFFVLGSEFFVRYKLVIKKPQTIVKEGE